MPYEKRAYTDGRLQPGTEVRIVNLDGRDLGRGEQGEILTRGPELFMGYTDSRLDVDCFVDDGWLPHGRPSVTSTATDISRSPIGSRTSSSAAARTSRPREVEDVLVRHPQVQQVAVIGLPDERYGECVCAAVVPKEAASPTLDSLLRHCREAGLASFKTPARLVVVPALPMTASGQGAQGAAARGVARAPLIATQARAYLRVAEPAGVGQRSHVVCGVAEQNFQIIVRRRK